MSIEDTSSTDTTTGPDFIVLEASEGISDSSIILNWSNCGGNYVYILMSSAFEESSYTTLDSNITDTFYFHKNVEPGPYSYRMIAINTADGDSLTSTDIGYRTISNLEFF